MSLQARYTILRKIADGGTAEIFLAAQRGAHGFEKPVVLKRIFPAFYADPQFRNMLVDEAHIAMSLNHSNIVQVLDLGEADGQYVLALELVDGWTLDSVLRRARALKTSVPPALALYMTAEVCRALAYAHAKVGQNQTPLGIVHRDISPHNLLLSEQGEVKLTDFGIAKAHNRRESSLGNVIKGKIAYMSPEQASGTPIDARSDLFSVGTMLYVMVCHRYPFDAATDLEVLLLVKNGAYEAPEKALPGLNPEIYRVIKRAMSKAPEDRYQRADEMLVDVEHVMRVAFRAVGQTELKRWLQDLSMRDGIPPLTRMPAPPPTTAAGRVAGETLELKGVGSTNVPAPLPPPTLGARTNPAPATHLPGMTGGPGTRLRPPPPSAAMSVGKSFGIKPATVGRPAAGIPTNRSSGPGSGPTGVPTSVANTPSKRFTFGAGEDSDDEEPLPEDEATEITPTPMPLSRQSEHHPPPAEASRRSQAPHPIAEAAGATGATEAILPTSSAGKAGGAAEPATTAATTEATGAPPVAPRKSSSWVAEAVLASAQRAGITPPPPIVNVVPPPPVRGMAPAGAVSAPAETVDPAPIAPPPRNRALVIGSGLAAVAALAIGISVRSCHTGSAVRTTVTTVPPTDPAGTTKGVAVPAPPLTAAMAIPAGATDGGANSQDATPLSPGATAATESAHAPNAGPREGGAAAALSGALAGTGESTSEKMAASGPTTEPAVSPPAGDATVGPVAAVPARDAPAPVTAAGSSSPTTAPADAPGGGNAVAEASGDPDGGTVAPAKVAVTLSSTPPGAQVGTTRRSFGTTPALANLKVGRTYNLVFTLEGYRSVTKQFRVANFADQEVTAVLRKETPSAKSQTPPTGQPPAPAKPEKNWFQRMFAR